MFDSGVLEVGIGLIFTFLTVSLVCGQVTETIATILSWRATTLMDGSCTCARRVRPPIGKVLRIDDVPDLYCRREWCREEGAECKKWPKVP